MREPKQVSRPEVIGSGREVPIDGLAVEHREHRFYPRTRRDQGRSRLWRWQFTRIVCRWSGAREGAGRRSRLARLPADDTRSEEHTSELQSLMRISYAVFCLKKKKKHNTQHH